jgi:DNA-binding transcriptional regulator PaaX
MKDVQRMGPTMKKIMILMKMGLILSFSTRQRSPLKILKGASKEWDEINEQVARRAIKKLYQSHLINFKDNKDGTSTLTLTNSGKLRVLQYDIDKIEIKRSTQWDHLWRIVIFDIPENKKQARDAISYKLKQLNFYPLQKSVFIYPYNCKNEIDFIIEVFQIKPYVRFIIAKETDIDLQLKKFFNIN